MNKIITRKVFVLFLILSLFFNQSNTYLSANNENNRLDLKTNLEEKVPDLMKKYNIPGVSIASINNGEIEWIENYGYADKNKKLPVNNNTIFQVGSISKTFTAWGIMNLVEEGKLDLDTSVENYLTRWHIPDTTFNKDYVTIRKILSHTAGLSVPSYAGYSPNSTLPSIEQSLSGESNDIYRLELISEPGKQFQYSGGGYTLLQLVIEEVTGLSFSKYMENEVLKPLGMENSFFDIDYSLESNISKGYGYFGQELPNYIYTEKAAAGLYTTIDDMANFVVSNQKILRSNEEILLSPDSLRTMTSQVEVNGQYTNYGLGYQVRELSSGEKMISHGGTNRGWNSQFSYLPDRNNGIIILTNSDMGHHLINDMQNDWIEIITGEQTQQYKNTVKIQEILRWINIILLVGLLLYITKIFVQIKRGLRKLSINLSKKAWARIITSFIIIILWLSIFFLPWYGGGWTIAPFLPIGFGWLTILVVLWLLAFSLAVFFPKNKYIKIFSDSSS